MKKRTAIEWMIGLLIILVLIIIIFEQSSNDGISSRVESKGVSNSVSELVIALGGEADVDFDDVHFLTRKFAHLVEYFILALIVFGIIYVLSRHSLFTILVGLLILVCIPIIDEFVIQSRIMGRSSQVIDVLIDYLGITCGMISYLFGRFLVVVRER